MSNVCRRCGHLIEYSLVPLSKIKNSYCHFCINEYEAMTSELNKKLEKRLDEFEKSFKSFTERSR